jgi:hypothetical protein
MSTLPAVLLVGLSALPAPQSPQTPFKASVELVTIDVVATTGRGEPVLDLTSRDLILKIDGRARDIEKLELIQVGKTPASSPEGSTGSTSAGRSILFVLDTESIRPGDERTVMQSAVRFLDGLAAQDRLALVVLPRLDGPLAFDRDKAELRRALSSASGHASSAPDPCERGFTTRSVLASFKADSKPRQQIRRRRPRRQFLHWVLPVIQELRRRRRYGLRPAPTKPVIAETGGAPPLIPVNSLRAFHVYVFDPSDIRFPLSSYEKFVPPKVAI